MTRRAYYWPILIVGIIMIVMPFAISMPSKTSAGQNMLDNFHSMMQPASVKVANTYFDDTFLPLKPVATGGIAAASEETALMTGLATAMHMNQVQLSSYLGAKYPAMAQLLASFPQMVPVFEKVSPGLAYYQPLVTTMSENVNNYAKVDSLPNFNLFTWFFVVPGALISLFALLGLGLFGRKGAAK